MMTDKDYEQLMLILLKISIDTGCHKFALYSKRHSEDDFQIADFTMPVSRYAYGKTIKECVEKLKPNDPE